MDLNNSLGYLVNRTARMMKRDLDKRLKNYDLTTSQWSVLKVLSEQDNLTQAQIAERFDIDRATCGSIIDKLIKKDLLIKELGKEDRRSYVVTLTSKSHAIIDSITKEAIQCNLDAIDGIDSKSLDTFYEVMQMINNNLGGK